MIDRHEKDLDRHGISNDMARTLKDRRKTSLVAEILKDMKRISLDMRRI